MTSESPASSLSIPSLLWVLTSAHSAQTTLSYTVFCLSPLVDKEEKFTCLENRPESENYNLWVKLSSVCCCYFHHKGLLGHSQLTVAVLL